MESDKEGTNDSNDGYKKWHDTMSGVNFESDRKREIGSTKSEENFTNSIKQKELKTSEPIRGPMAEWADGFDIATRSPYPFNCDVDEDFYDQDELRAVLADKNDDEARIIIEKNQETMVRNNEEIDKLNHRILEIYEMPPEERKALYNDKQTSKGEKSLIACVEYYSMPEEKRSEVAYSETELFNNLMETTYYLYGFNLILARDSLKSAGSHFNILTKKEREEVGEGSVEDIVSAALESFVMSPYYDERGQIKEFDDFLYGIMLDCTKRKVANTDDIRTIEETVDLEEFQARVTESMTNVFFEEGLDKIYSGSDYWDVVLKKVPELRADIDTGHHFVSEQINKEDGISVKSPFSGKVHEVGYSTSFLVDSKRYWANFEKRVRKNSEEVFNYDKALARIEMEPWADKIDLGKIESINSSAEPLEEKIKKIMEYIQEIFDIKNTDSSGVGQPIELKWFRYKTPLTAMQNLFYGKAKSGESVPESRVGTLGYYYNKCVYLPNTLKKNNRLSSRNIGTIVHEMWHAKQEEAEASPHNSNHDKKARMYFVNDLAYVTFRVATFSGYLSQIMEREAFAIGGMIEQRMIKHRFRTTGEKIMRLFTSLANLGDA